MQSHRSAPVLVTREDVPRHLRFLNISLFCSETIRYCKELGLNKCNTIRVLKKVNSEYKLYPISLRRHRLLLGLEITALQVFIDGVLFTVLDEIVNML